MKFIFVVLFNILLLIPCSGQSKIPDEFWSQEIAIANYSGNIGTPTQFNNPIFIEKNNELISQTSILENEHIYFDLFSVNTITDKKSRTRYVFKYTPHSLYTVFEGIVVYEDDLITIQENEYMLSPTDKLLLLFAYGLNISWE